MEEKERDYTTVSIPNDLAAKIDKFLEEHPGYQNRADFVRDAIRRLLGTLEKEA